MASRAEKIVSGEVDPPRWLQEAMDDVEAASKRVASTHRAAGIEDHPSHAFRYEVVDGEVIEIRVDSENDDARLIHRPDLTPPHVGGTPLRSSSPSASHE